MNWVWFILAGGWAVLAVIHFAVHHDFTDFLLRANLAVFAFLLGRGG